ncbi:MAG TPA: FAD-dependent oxidoreductase [Nitrososphaeraceae archaeon]|nr:FAD-dependent oxidoreductase [Nitrososphaeraceae archaeon]
MKKVVVAGAGYGGLFSAANLLANGNEKKFDITVFDKNPYHQLLQQIHLVSAGVKKPEAISFSINELLKNEISFINECVFSVDLDNKVITTLSDNLKNSSKHEYKFDYIIIALGSSNAYFNIKGAQENAFSFRSLDDAINLHKKLEEIPSQSNIVICGGGATGISLAGALTDEYISSFKVTVIEAQEDILPGWDLKLISEIKNFLRTRGIRMVTNNPIKEVGPSFVILKDDTKVDSAVSVWTAGIKGRDIKIMPEIRKTRSNRIIVNKYSQIEGYDYAFAVGDISAFPLNDVLFSPQLAQFAVRQARNVAKNIIRIESGDKPMVEFEYQQHGSILSLGTKCMGIMNGVIIKGTLCEYVEDFLIDNYITAIRNKGKGLSGLAYEQDAISQISTSLNFMISTAARIFSSHNK